MSPSMKDHWNSIYSCRAPTQLGWYQDAPEASARLLEKCDLNPSSPILDVGAGATVFIDYLLDQGFRNITAADISEVALSKLKERLGPERSSSVRWIVDDITRSQVIKNMTDVALWHDRAVLHFLIQEEDRRGYLETLEGVVRPGDTPLSRPSIPGGPRCAAGCR